MLPFDWLIELIPLRSHFTSINICKERQEDDRLLCTNTGTEYATSDGRHAAEENEKSSRHQRNTVKIGVNSTLVDQL